MLRARASLLFLVAVAACACGSTEQPAAPTCKAVELIAAVGDHQYTSSLCAVPGACVHGEELGAQPVLASSNGRVFLVARDKDLLVEVDSSCGAPIAKFGLDRVAPRDGLGKTGTANPHDAAVTRDGSLVVPLYNVAKLAFIKGAEIQTMDLSAYDADGNPQAESVTIVDVDGAEKAFVALERLDDRNQLRSTQASQMLRIDVATRTAEATIDLEGRNPFNPMAVLDGALFLSEPGNFDSADDDHAGIERFDTSTSKASLLVSEKALGASVVQVAVTKRCGAAIVAGPEKNVNPTSVVTFDPDTGRILRAVAAPLYGPTPGYELYGLTWRGNRLYIGDRRRGAVSYPVHVFEDTGGCNLRDTQTTVDLEQAPIALAPAR